MRNSEIRNQKEDIRRNKPGETQKKYRWKLVGGAWIVYLNIKNADASVLVLQRDQECQHSEKPLPDECRTTSKYYLEHFTRTTCFGFQERKAGGKRKWNADRTDIRGGAATTLHSAVL
jgi:hypothetical protein